MGVGRADKFRRMVGVGVGRAGKVVGGRAAKDDDGSGWSR